jgi:hypothetical protein
MTALALSFPLPEPLRAVFGRLRPPAPLRLFFRGVAATLQPPRPLPHACTVTRAQDALLASGRAAPHQLATLLCEQRAGPVPTIVLGGFVPDAPEQVFLLRRFLLRQGSVFYLNYPRGGFSLDLLCAQLDDLVEELSVRHGRPPVMFGVSFGAGIVLEWLRQARVAGREPDLAGLALVSPVACVADVFAPGEAKPSTLLGRALKPCLDLGAGLDAATADRSRAIFIRMFEAGAQNETALRSLMTPGELRQLRAGVIGTIRGIEVAGVHERIAALSRLAPPAAEERPLSTAPALVLYAEKEGAVLTANSPTRAAFASALPALFPRGKMRIVAAHGGSPVQHASLIFHYARYRPRLAAYYRSLSPAHLAGA